MARNKVTVSIIILMMFAFMVSGCSNSHKMAQIKDYVKKVKSQSIRDIEPLPIVKPYETYTYHDENLRSPFTPPLPETATRKVITDNGIHPDINRHKEPLEAYPLDSLRMVGTLQQDSKIWAIIVDPKGTVHRITKGNYVGQNDGRVDNITENKVNVTEIVSDPSGGWRERKGEMALLTESSSSKESANNNKNKPN